MSRFLSGLSVAAVAWTFTLPLGAAQAGFPPDEAEDKAFLQAARLYQASHRENAETIKAFETFVRRYASSPRVAAAQFTIGELQFDWGLDALARDQDFVKDPFSGRLSRVARGHFQEAQAAYTAVLQHGTDDALKDSARQRLGELAYNRREWDAAIELFKVVVASQRDSYVKPVSLASLACAYLAKQIFAKSALALRVIERSYPEQLRSPEVLLVRGVLALHDKRYADAERFLKEIDSPQAQYQLGKTYLRWGKPLLAAGIFDKLETVQPASSLREAARFFLADSFLVSKNYDGAMEKYKALLRDLPSSRFAAAALFRVGAVQFEKGSYEEARRTFQTVASQGRDDYYARLARYMIAESYLAAAQFKEALGVYTQLAADERFNERPLALFKAAWAQRSLGDTAGAIKTARRFLSLYPKSPLAAHVYLMLGNVMVERKDYDGAREMFERVIDISPETAIAEQALFLMLKFEYDLKRYNFILTSHQFLLTKLSPEPSKWKSFSRLIIADTYVRFGRVQEARSLYSGLLKSSVHGVAAIYAQDGLAWCDLIGGQAKQAGLDRRRLKSMLKAASSSSTVANLNDLGLADSFYAQKDYASAQELYAKFAEDQPTQPAAGIALFRAGDCLYRQKYYAQAVETWEKLVAHMPASPEAQKASLRIADTLFRAGKYQESETAYQKILERQPEASQASFVNLRLAQSAFYRHDDDLALTRAQDLLGRFPQSAEINDGLDLIEAVFERSPKRDFKAFIQGLMAAKPSGPAAAQAEFRLARSLYDQKKHAEAAAEFERFSVDHAADPLLPKAQLYLGESFFLLKDYAKAAVVFERYAGSYSSAEDIPLALFHLGSSYYGLEQHAKAAAAYRRLVEEHADSQYAEAARFNLALAYEKGGEPEKAQHAYEEFLRASPGSEQALSALWSVFDIQQKAGAYAEAVRTLRKLAARSQGDAETSIEAAYKLGEIQEMMGEAAQARKTWAGLLEAKPAANPYRLQALIQLAKMYEKTREVDKATAVYEDLAKNAPDPAVVDAARERIKELLPSRPPARKKAARDD